MLLTVFLNCFQLAIFLVDLYFSKSLLQLVSHQLFKCLKILIILEFLSQALLAIQVNESTMFSRDLVSDKLEVSIEEMFFIKSLMNDFSFSLSLLIECLELLVCYSSIGIVTVRGVWSNDNLHFWWIVWLSSSTDLYLKNMRSITECEFWSLSKNLVRTGLVGYERLSKRKSIMSKRISLWAE